MILESGLRCINTPALSNKLNEVKTQKSPENQSQQATTQAAQTPTATASANSVVKSAKVGEYVTFGRYEQDANTGNGAEPVEWLVLDNKGDKMLVISRYGLDSKPYNVTQTDVTWETCTLRNWLNTEFYNTSFNDSEKASVITTTVNNPDNSSYGTKGGNATKDKVFCLSIDEAKNYYTSNRVRATKPTAYALSRGAYVNITNDWESGNCWWWLRSPAVLSILLLMSTTLVALTTTATMSSLMLTQFVLLCGYQ